MSKVNNCMGCTYFFITHRVERPYGCKAFNFISKNIPYRDVLNSSGTKCAYRKVRNPKVMEKN